MRKFILGIIILFTFLNYSCNSKKENDKLLEIADRIEDLINLPGQTSENLNFNKFYLIDGSIINIKWVPSDNSVISEDGIVSRSFKNKDINLKIIITHDNQNIERDLGNLTVLAYSNDEILYLLKQVIDIPLIVTENLTLPLNCEILGSSAKLSWISSNQKVLSNQGVVYFDDIEQKTNLSVDLNIESYKYNLNWGEITIPSKTPLQQVEYISSTISLPLSTYTDLILPKRIGNVSIFWTSSNSNILSNTGKWYFSLENTVVTLSAIFYYNGHYAEKEYIINVLTLTDEERINLNFDEITLPEYVSTNLNLMTSFNYNVTGKWISNNEKIINNQGLINLTDQSHIIILTLILTSGDKTMEKDFTVTTTTINDGELYLNNHMLINRVNDFNDNSLINLYKDDNRILINYNTIEGSYESSIYRTNLFTKLVGSWSAISNQNATCELLIKVRVNGNWSKYFSYGKWGLGLKNAMNINQTDNIAKMSEDEIVINNNQKGDAFQYKIILHRTSLSNISPKVSLVAITLNIPDYQYHIETNNLPNFVDYDVPMLYQHDVPIIGGSICSITSSTMLLLYKGHSFRTNLPHQENSELFFDYGNQIYGNWVYNTVGISAFGENSYVKRIYSFDELRYHLVSFGPVALSIKGNTGLYSTNGHLIVVRGYRITENETKILCNDPNVKGVYVEYPIETFLNVTRNIIYVVE